MDKVEALAGEDHCGLEIARSGRGRVTILFAIKLSTKLLLSPCQRCDRSFASAACIDLGPIERAHDIEDLRSQGFVPSPAHDARLGVRMAQSFMTGVKTCPKKHSCGSEQERCG